MQVGQRMEQVDLTGKVIWNAQICLSAGTQYNCKLHVDEITQKVRLGLAAFPLANP